MIRIKITLIFLLTYSALIALAADPIYTAIKANENSFAFNQRKYSSNIYPNYLQIPDSTVNKSSKIQLKEKATGNRWVKASIVPAALVTAGIVTLIPESHCLLSKYTIHDKVLELFPNTTTKIDNYLQYAPLATVFALKAAGVKSKSNFVNQVVISAKAELLMTTIVTVLKNVTQMERPSGGSVHSMPSGHTAQAFLSATILDMEYRDVSPWIGVAGYAAATTTGVMRMVNNKHWISDVLVGAGIGILSTKAVYFTHQYKWGKKKNNMVILPTLLPKGAGFAFAMNL